jgi:hypothetical protein
VQDIVNQVRLIPDLATVFGQVSGYSLEPALTVANEVLAYFFGVSFPWKFNEFIVPPFYTTSYQQDYAVAGVTTLGWLQSGDCVDINNQALPKTRIQVNVVRQLPRTAAYGYQSNFLGAPQFSVCWLDNDQLYYGTWGAGMTGNATTGNNPQANQVIFNPLVGGKSQPNNPITQIQDANGNFLVLTTYGTTGSTAPVLPANSAAGLTVTDGSVVWTVVDPKGQGFRIFPPPTQSGCLWQFNLRGQSKPPAYLTSLDTLISPIPDEYSHIFRQGFISIAYRYSPEAKVRARYAEEFKLWQLAMADARMQSDRENEAYSFIPVCGIVAPVGCGRVTPGNPWGST